MDFEEMRNMWNRVTISSDSLNNDRRESQRARSLDKACSARQKLAKAFIIKTYSAVLLPLLAPMLIFVLHFPLWFAIVYACSGLVFGVINLKMYYYIKATDYISVPTVEAIKHAIELRRKYMQMLFCDVMLGVVILSIFFFEAFSLGGEELIIGAVVGLVVGGIIAYAKYKRDRYLIAQMEGALRDSMES